MTLDDYVNYIEGYVINTEEKDGKYYVYREGGYTDIYECDEYGNVTANSFDENGQCYETLHADSNGNYEVSSSSGILVKKRDVLSKDHYIYTSYYPDGKTIKNVSENTGNDWKYYYYSDNGSLNAMSENIDGEWTLTVMYDENGNVTYKQEGDVTNYYDSNGNVTYHEKGDVYTYYEYDSENRLIGSIERNDKEKTKVVDKIYYNQFFDGPVHKAETKEMLVDDVLIYSKEYDSDKLVKVSNYEYYENGRIKKISETKYVDDVTVETQITYDEDGKMQVISDYEKNGDLLLHLTDNNSCVGVVPVEDGSYSFYIDGDVEFLSIDKDGNRTYRYYDEYGNSYKIVLEKNGSYTLSGDDNNNDEIILTGTYSFDENGHILCIDENNNKYEYNSYGQLIRKETIDGLIYEYNNELKSEKRIKDGKVTYSLMNHIEYDEETYEAIMKGMISISEEYPQLVNNDCNNCVDIINSFTDKYSSGEVTAVNNEVQGIISTINDVKEAINYSLLAYSACDKHLEEKTHSLIDSLFDESEKSLARVFKRDISKNLDDLDNDKILDYKEGTNFNEILTRYLPLNKEIDEDGNIWYCNLKDEILDVEGINPKIIYGDQEFRVETTENGILRLVDSDGKPLNIFGDYNIEYKQYGGDQSAFARLGSTCDEKIQRILDKYFDEGYSGEREQYLDTVASTGCGYTALTNMVFKEFEGNEEGFYDTFGFPMYTINKYDNISRVDYNYEPIILELYSEINGRDRAISNSSANGDGSSREVYYRMYKYMQDEYGVFKEDYNTYMEKCGIFHDIGYNLYTLDGEMYYPNGGCHAMTKLGELEDGRWIVSSWGEKFICETKEPMYEMVTEEELREWGLI